MSRNKIRDEVEAALCSTGLAWEIRRSATNHCQVYLAGKKIGVICQHDHDRRDAKQILAKIRGRVKELSA